ncbi:MAG TPA: hypothetical protein VIK31_00010 [Propionibacteriaceae bacterium]
MRTPTAYTHLHPTTMQQDGGSSPSDGEPPPPRRLNAWVDTLRDPSGRLGIDGTMLL